MRTANRRKYRFKKRKKSMELSLVLSISLFCLLFLIPNEFNFELISIFPFEMETTKDFYLKNKVFDESQCRMCDFEVLPTVFQTNSEKNDIILAYVYKKGANLIPFIRSIRTTHTSASVVLLYSSDLIKNDDPKYIKLIKTCGVQIVVIQDRNLTRKSDILYYQIFLYIQFLSTNAHRLNRVILVDLYESIFQQDPFTTNFLNDYVYFTNTGANLLDCQRFEEIIDPNIKFFNIICPKTSKNKLLMKNIYQRTLISDALIAGGVNQILKLLSYMEKIGDRSIMKAYGDVQLMMQFFLRTGLFDPLFNKIVLNPRSHFMMSVGLFQEAYNVPQMFENTTLGNITILDKIPAIIHQYQFNDFIKSSVLDSCMYSDG